MENGLVVEGKDGRCLRLVRAAAEVSGLADGKQTVRERGVGVDVCRQFDGADGQRGGTDGSDGVAVREAQFAVGRVISDVAERKL